MSESVKLAMIGCGGMARHHLRTILQQRDTTEVAVLCEPSPTALAPDLDKLLATYDVDAAFIVTPHVYHHDQAKQCMEAGLDVLLEKPMVMNAEEARSLIDVRDRTGRLLAVAFNGSLSPEIREAVRLLRSGKLGQLLSISATIWQSWGQPGPTTSGGLWRRWPW